MFLPGEFTGVSLRPSAPDGSGALPTADGNGIAPNVAREWCPHGGGTPDTDKAVVTFHSGPLDDWPPAAACHDAGASTNRRKRHGGKKLRSSVQQPVGIGRTSDGSGTAISNHGRKKHGASFGAPNLEPAGDISRTFAVAGGLGLDEVITKLGSVGLGKEPGASSDGVRFIPEVVLGHGDSIAHHRAVAELDAFIEQAVPNGIRQLVSEVIRSRCADHEPPSLALVEALKGLADEEQRRLLTVLDGTKSFEGRVLFNNLNRLTGGYAYTG